jgi:PAS domain S-box-containing protein
MTDRSLGDARQQWAATGSFGARIAAHNWAATPLGPIEGWSTALKTLVGLMLNSRQPMFIAWGPDQTWLYNEAFVPIAGRKHPDCLGRPSSEVWAEAWADLKPLFAQVYAGEPVHMDDISLELDRRGRLEEAHFAFSYTPAREGDGSVGGLFGVCIETTDQILSNRDLAAEQQRYAQLNETLERRVAERTAELQNIQTFYMHSSECHATLSLRDNGTFEYDEINPATLQLYKMSREQVIGRTVDEIFEFPAAAELSGHLREAMRRGEPYRYSRAQAQSMIEAVVTPIPAEPGKRPRLAVTARDITERQNLEEQLRQAQKMEAVGQLTGGLAHDFNNLLQGITGALDRVQHRIATGRTADVDRFLKAAMESANRAAALTHRLLAFSRRQTLAPKPIDVNRLIGGMEDLISRTMGPAVRVAVVGAAGLWPVRVDPSQLESTLLNLCINARDAMPDGGRLTIETANKWMDARAARDRDLAPGQYVSLCVTDNGSGMEPNVIEHAFDPFFTTKPIGQGTGLGLSMTYGFVRQSGGQVRIYSEIGKGSTICLYFPRYAGVAEEESVEAPGETVEAGTGETVLVVDDEATVRMLISEVLGDAGYKVLEAPDGPAALKILQSDKKLDLMITDVGLPGGMNGRQVADAARVQRKDLKILFITGFAENAVVGNGYLDTGMEILAKPFAMSTLAHRVREMIDG